VGQPIPISGQSIDVATQAELDAAIAALPSTYQPLDSDLTAIAALASAADKVAYATGAGTWALADLSVFARTLIDDVSAAAARATLAALTTDSKIVQSVSGASSITFSSLNGNTDGGYRLSLVGALTQGGTARYVTLRPNNDATANYANSGIFATAGNSSAGGLVGPGGGTGLSLCAMNVNAQAVTGNGNIAVHGLLAAQTGQIRAWNFVQNHNLGSFAYSGYGAWNDTTNNLTSLVIDMGGATFTGLAILEKMASV
jgi:hypothetical protein